MHKFGPKSKQKLNEIGKYIKISFQDDFFNTLENSLECCFKNGIWNNIQRNIDESLHGSLGESIDIWDSLIDEYE